MAIVPKPVWPVGALLGEGPAWFANEQVVRFVDIKQGLVHRFDPASGSRSTLETGGNPSFVVPADDGSIVLGSRHRIHRLPREGQGIEGLGEVIATIDQPAHNRTNDATVDEHGRLWIATMDDEESQPTGTVWCMDTQGLHHAGSRAVVTNGPATTADGRFLYHVDSGARTITRYSLGEGPALRDGEVFLQLTEADGHPDGIVLDAEDCLWVALWDGWAVRRYGPDGRLLLQVDFPCARITKLALGGPDLRTAFVTTARVGLDEAALAAQPLAGALFAFEAPAPGRLLPAVRLR